SGSGERRFRRRDSSGDKLCRPVGRRSLSSGPSISVTVGSCTVAWEGSRLNQRAQSFGDCPWRGVRRYCWSVRICAHHGGPSVGGVSRGARWLIAGLLAAMLLPRPVQAEDRDSATVGKITLLNRKA